MCCSGASSWATIPFAGKEFGLSSGTTASRQRPIVLCVNPADKHLLQHVKTRRIVSRPLGNPGDAIDIVLFQAGQNLDFIHRALSAPAAVWRQAREGRGTVVFDASTEGKPHTAETSDRLHHLLRQVDVPLNRAVYVTQDRGYAEDYAAYCARLGLGETMKIVVHDYWIRRSLSDFEETGAEVLASRRAAFEGRANTRSRRFLSLNFTPRPTRLLFMLRLLGDGLWEHGFVSFGGFDQMVLRKGKSFESIRDDFLALPGFEDQTNSLAHLLNEFAVRGRFVLGNVPVATPYSVTIRPDELKEYHDSWFTVVTETEMLNRPSRITEKPLKPLLNFHPFIVFGNPGSLKLVRDLGFETFPEIFDEAYDGELDPRRRFDMAFNDIARLCRMDQAELASLAASVSEKLLFNADWGLVKLPGIFRNEIDEQLMRDLGVCLDPRTEAAPPSPQGPQHLRL